jgi:hypothetical protein
VPVELDRRTVLYLDGIRYCFHIFDITSTRLAESLQSLSSRDQASDLLADRIATAIADAWTLIDSTHRLRELLSQVPRLKKSTPELQVFLRSTASAEGLRHFYQHFRTEIDQFVSAGAPLWGSLSWIHTDPANGENSCYIAAPGTFFQGAAVPSCTIDTFHNKYVERVAFFAGSAKIDLAELSDQVHQLCVWYTDWYASTFAGNDVHTADLHMAMQVRAVSRKVGGDEAGSGSASET